MGWALSWLAVKGKSADEVCTELALRRTGQPGDYGDFPFVGATSSAGWFLIVANCCEHGMISTPVMQKLSLGCEALTCTVEEHVMFSEAAGWRNGQRTWRVTHVGEDGAASGVAEKGELPPEYPALLEKATHLQAEEDRGDGEVDYLFEVPVALVQTFTGFKHDEASPVFEDAGFELLESTQQTLLQRLFG